MPELGNGLVLRGTIWVVDELLFQQWWESISTDDRNAFIAAGGTAVEAQFVFAYLNLREQPDGLAMAWGAATERPTKEATTLPGAKRALERESVTVLVERLRQRELSIVASRIERRYAELVEQTLVQGADLELGDRLRVIEVVGKFLKDRNAEKRAKPERNVVQAQQLQDGSWGVVEPSVEELRALVSTAAKRLGKDEASVILGLS